MQSITFARSRPVPPSIHRIPIRASEKYSEAPRLRRTMKSQHREDVLWGYAMRNIIRQMLWPASSGTTSGPAARWWESVWSYDLHSVYDQDRNSGKDSHLASMLRMENDLEKPQIRLLHVGALSCVFSACARRGFGTNRRRTREGAPLFSK